MGSSESVPSTLTAELAGLLALLADQPDGVAEVALSALPYGSRASLISHDIIEPVPTTGDAPVEITLTDNGWRVIHEAAKLHRDPDRDESERREAEADLERAYADWQHDLETSPASTPSSDSRNGTHGRNRALAVAAGAAGVAGVAGGAVAGHWVEERLSRTLTLNWVRAFPAVLEILANFSPGPQPRRRSAIKRRIGLFLLALGAVTAVLASSEKLRSQLLDVLFGAEEEFQYIPPQRESELSASASATR